MEEMQSINELIRELREEVESENTSSSAAIPLLYNHLMMTLLYIESLAKRIENLDTKVDLLAKHALLDSEDSPEEATGH